MLKVLQSLGKDRKTQQSARDVTGFYTFFSARAIFFHILGRFPLPKLHREKPWRKRENIHWRNQKSSGDGAPKLQMNLSQRMAQAIFCDAHIALQKSLVLVPSYL